MPYRDGTGPNGDNQNFGRRNGRCGSDGQTRGNWLGQRGGNRFRNTQAVFPTSYKNEVKELRSTVERLAQLVEELVKRS